MTAQHGLPPSAREGSSNEARPWRILAAGARLLGRIGGCWRDGGYCSALVPGAEGDAYVVRFKVGRSDRDHFSRLYVVISVGTRNHCTLALCLDDSSQSDAVRELIEIGFGPQFLADLAVEAVERHVRRYRYDPECTVCGTVGYLSGAESQTVRTYLLLHVCAPLPQPVLRHINLTGLPSSGTLYSTVLHSSTR